MSHAVKVAMLAWLLYAAILVFVLWLGWPWQMPVLYRAVYGAVIGGPALILSFEMAKRLVRSWQW